MAILSLGATFGARVEVEVGRSAEDRLRAVRDEVVAAVRSHHLATISLPEMDAESHVALMSLLGPVADEYDTGVGYTVMSNNAVGGFGREAELVWHADYASTPYPHDFLSLHATAIEGGATATRFVTTARVGELPDELKRDIEGRVSINVARTNGVADVDMEREWDSIVARLAGADVALVVTRKPIIATDPHSGLHYIDVNPMMTAGIEGCSFADGRALLDELFRFLYDQAQVLEQHWSPGEFAVWNNRLTQHSRAAVPRAAGTRTLRRVAVNANLAAVHRVLPDMVSNRPFVVSQPST